MFSITRNNKRFNNKKFPTYEEARNYIRTWAVNNKLAPTQMHVRLTQLGFKIRHI